MTPDDIRALRKQRGWTTRQLATAIGVGPLLVQAWEAGEQFPTRKAIDKMRSAQEQGSEVGAAPGESSPWQALADPALWALMRKLAAYPDLRVEVERLAANHADPALAGK